MYPLKRIRREARVVYNVFNRGSNGALLFHEYDFIFFFLLYFIRYRLRRCSHSIVRGIVRFGIYKFFIIF